jgi:hypothetical protein
MYWGRGDIAICILDLSTRWAICPSHFTSKERALSNHYIRGWVDPRARHSGEEKNFQALLGIKP